MPLTLLKVGRAFFGLCLIGLGIQQFQYGEFRPAFAPDWPAWLQHPVLAYIFGAALILASGIIILAKNARRVSMISALVFLFFFIFFHVIFLFKESKLSLADWINPLKELALAGGALIVAASYQQPNTITNNSAFSLLEKLIPLGRFFFGLMLATFGLTHFVYAQFAASLVPAWIPGHMFWTYFAGIALIGAGLGFISNYQIRLISLLTAVMIFIWFIVLHIPRGIADPEGLKGNEITSVFQALGFSGIALVTYALSFATDTLKRTPTVSFPNEAAR